MKFSLSVANQLFLPGEGRVCKTNLPSNTAFRGFGGPQGMIVTEAWVEHIAHQLSAFSLLPPLD